MSRGLSNEELIDLMETLRVRQNKNWMDFLRLAFDAHPEEAKAIARRIKEGDESIADVFGELGRS